MFRSPQFCQQNGIPSLIQQNVASVAKLGIQIFDMLFLMESQKSAINISQFKFLKKLLSIIYCKQKLEDQQQEIVEIIIGSFLVPQIYQFQFFLDQIKINNEKLFEEFQNSVQQQQMRINTNNSNTVIQTNQNLVFLYNIFTQDIQLSKVHLDQYLIARLQINPQQLKFDSIITQLKQFINIGINIQECYFAVIWYLWTKYNSYFNLAEEIKKHEINRDKTVEERRKGLYERFLAKQKKRVNDEIFIYFVHRQVLFVESLEDCVAVESYSHYRNQQISFQAQYIEYNFKSLHQVISLDETSLNRFWQLIQKLDYEFLTKQNVNQDKVLTKFVFFFWLFKTDTSIYKQIQILFKLKEFTLNSLAQLIQLSFPEKGKWFIINLFTIAADFHQFDPSNFKLLYCYYLEYGHFDNAEMLLQFNTLLQSKKINLHKLEFISNLKIQHLKEIKKLIDIDSLEGFVRDLIEAYLKIAPIHQKLFYKAFKNLYVVLPNNRNKKLECFYILLNNVQSHLLQSVFLLNKRNPIQKNTYQITLFIFYKFLDFLQDQKASDFFSNLIWLFPNSCYDFPLMLQLKNQNIQKKLIHNVMLIQYFHLVQDIPQMQKHCQYVFGLNEKLYSQCFQNLNYHEIFTLTPKVLRRAEIQKMYPVNLEIELENFNISLAELTQNEQQQVCFDWIQNMNDKEKFLKLIPFFFNIIKRGESPRQLLQLIHFGQNKKSQFFFNMKALFQILFNNSNDELKVMLLKFRSKDNPVPLVYQNLSDKSIKQEENLFCLNHYLFYIYSDCFTVINFSLSKKQSPIGKTQLINQIFFQQDKVFETNDTNEINQNTIDLMFDFTFNSSRNFTVADTHGVIPMSILKKILPLFKLWIVQIDSELELEENFNQLLELKDVRQSQKPKICILIRNSIPNLKQDRISQLFNQIKNNSISIHQVKDLTQKGIDQQIYDNQINSAQKFIYSQIESAGYLNNQMSRQQNFLKIIKDFSSESQQISNKIEMDNQIIEKFLQKLDTIIDQPEGFFSQDQFPMRSLELKIRTKREQLFQMRQKDNSQNKTFEDLKIEIDLLQNALHNQKMTDILELFCSIFETSNYYILYLTLTDKIRKFNLQKTFQLQNENEQLNQQIKNLKKQKSQTRSNNEDAQCQQIKDDIKKIREQLESNLKMIQFRNIGIEVFWREIIQHQQQCFQSEVKINCVEKIFQMIKKGEPFEFLDGDSLNINKQFLKQLIEKFEQKGNERVLVLSVLGPQSSGKSTILNKIFGCHFWTSVGRCTKGIYLQLLKVHNNKCFDQLFDYILLLDTEGLQNPNQQDPDFDKKIALFILAISDIILINVKGDIHQQFKNLVEMCIYTLGHMKSNFSSLKLLSWCFNQNNDVNNYAPFLDQINGIANNLNTEYNNDPSDQKLDYTEILDINRENIQILGFSSYEKSWKCDKSLGIFKEWRQQITNDTFSLEAYQYGIKIIKSFVQKFGLQNEIMQVSNLEDFIQTIDLNWISIQQLPDLLEFSELIQHQQNQQMKIKFEDIYNGIDFSFTQNIPREINQKLEQRQRQSIEIFNEIQQDQVLEITCKLDSIKNQIKEDLQTIKSQNRISKKIFLKYITQLDQRINTLLSECKIIILDEIQDYTRQYQVRQGFTLIDKFLLDLSSDSVKLKQYQSQQELISAKFDELWNNIMQQYEQQQISAFNEFQQNQYQQITKSFTEYNLKSNNEEEYYNFLKQNINQKNPFSNFTEKQKIFEIFSKELLQFQFMKLDRTQKNLRYMDIFHMPIEQKIKNSKPTDFINITENYLYQVFWLTVEKSKVLPYLKDKSNKDFFKIIDQCKKSNNYSQLCNFLSIFDFFNLEYDRNCMQNLHNKIKNPTFWTFASHEEQIYKAYFALCNSLPTVQYFPFSKFDLDIFNNFQNLYPQLETQKQNQTFYEVSKINERRDTMQNDHIILKEIQEIKPCQKKVQQYFSHFTFIQNPQKCVNNQVSNLPEVFNELMVQNNGWKRLYDEVYIIIRSEMMASQKCKSRGDGFSLKNNSFEEQDVQFDDDSQSYSSSLIKYIMSQIELKIVEYNKQFSNFGVILRDMGERCIYYYSILIIWRFVCYKKWKILEINKQKLADLKNNELEKFTAEITKNKSEQSKLKAQALVNEIFQGFQDRFYQEKSQLALQFISSKRISSSQLIHQLDEDLLFKNSNNVEEIVKYTSDQRKYLEEYVNQQINNIQIQVQTDYQMKLHQEMIQLLHQVYNNSETLKILIGDNIIKTKDYFKDRQQNDEFYETKLFQIVFCCLQGEQYQDLNIIDEQHRDIFEKYQYGKVSQKQMLSKISNESNQQIQQLKSFIQQVSEQFLQKIKTIEQIKINLTSLKIQNELQQIRFVMMGCQHSCPMCKRKCDLDNDGHQKHMCQNGHQLRGMNGVLIEDRPSLFTCEEIEDDALIITIETNIQRTWKEIISIYPEWQFRSLLKDTVEKNKENMIKIWNYGIGKQMCKWLALELNRPVVFEIKHNLSKFYQSTERMHYIFMLDDSGSMQGQKWNNVKNAAVACLTDIGKNPNARVSVIIFNTNARIVINCQKVDIAQQHHLIQFENGNTDFSKAFDASLQIIQSEAGKNFSKIVILFYTDGGAAYPKQQIQQFCALDEKTRGIINLIACTEESNTPVLQMIVENLRPYLQRVEYKNSMQTTAIKRVWSEVVSQNYHKLRC